MSLAYTRRLETGGTWSEFDWSNKLLQASHYLLIGICVGAAHIDYEAAQIGNNIVDGAGIDDRTCSIWMSLRREFS